MGSPSLRITERIDALHEWALYGGNGEYVCGSGSQGFTRAEDARRAAVRAAGLMHALAGGAWLADEVVEERFATAVNTEIVGARAELEGQETMPEMPVDE